MYENKHNLNYLQVSVDQAFRTQLSEIHSNLSLELNDYSYHRARESVAGARAIAYLTTYEEENDLLDIAFDHLYITMREDKSQPKVKENIEELREIINILNMNPKNKEALDKILAFSDKTYFKIE
jgi:hypothetical protein